uniref:G_PROTEIN_RECEP_F1_2 domain-containing protein n=1 Tax=Globodera rostochiensis TaxID=31243 RepID=A0A914IAS6_GLORO
MSDGDENLVYLTFKDQRPCWLLIAFAVPISLISSIGILLNFSVIYVTFKSKNLDGVANYLLALTSFFEVLQQFGSFLFLYTAISGTNFIDYSLAVQICALSLFGFGGVPICMFFTGVDRLICILAPIWHNSLRKRYYLGTILAICNFCGIMTALLFFKTAMDIPNLKLTGELSGLVYGDAGKYFSIYSFVFYSLTIAIYVVTGVWIKFRAQGGTTPNNQTNRRIFRSLFIIILMNIGGYFLMTICENFVLPKNTFASVWAWAFKKIVALPLNVSASSSAVILYVTSNEYRKAFGDEFGKVMKLLAFVIGTLPPPLLPCKFGTYNRRSPFQQQKWTMEAINGRPFLCRFRKKFN